MYSVGDLGKGIFTSRVSLVLESVVPLPPFSLNYA